MNQSWAVTSKLSSPVVKRDLATDFFEIVYFYIKS